MDFKIGDLVRKVRGDSYSSNTEGGHADYSYEGVIKQIVVRDDTCYLCGEVTKIGNCGYLIPGENFGSEIDNYILVVASDSLVPVSASSTEGCKADSGKPPCELLSPIALLGTTAVLQFGAKKYAPNNWRKGLAWSRVIGAIMRHLFAFMQGEDNDPETGLPHLDHLACEVMFLQEFSRTHKHLDDRFVGGNVTNKQENK